MRVLIAGLLVLAVIAPAAAAPRAPDITSNETALHWMSAYRAKPEPMQAPAVVRALSRIGTLHDPERCNAFVGFLAGVLGANPDKAEKLIAQSLDIRSEDRWIVVRALAYSGLPNWKTLMREFADRMPEQRVMIDKYVNGKMPRLDQLVIKPVPSAFERFSAHFRIESAAAEERRKTSELEPSSEVLDILWGYYFATGSYGPIMQIVALLPWAEDHDDAEWLTVGSMAKFTLASNAAHDRNLLEMLRSSSKAAKQPKETVAALKEIVDAAESVNVAPIRKQALAAIADLQRKGPAYKRNVSWWGYVGQSTIAAGCIAAAATGQVEFGLPCVIGGAGASAAMNFWANQP